MDQVWIQTDQERSGERKLGRKRNGYKWIQGRSGKKRRVEAQKEEERMVGGYWENVERVESRSMEGRGKDGEWILVGSGEEQKHGRKRKGWRVDIGRIWRGAVAWKEEERMESRYW